MVAAKPELFSTYGSVLLTSCVVVFSGSAFGSALGVCLGSGCELCFFVTFGAASFVLPEPSTLFLKFFLATISPSHPIDLSNKFEKASRYKGPKLFIAFSPCPPGWAFGSSKSVNVAKLAVQTGLLPLKEAVYGEVKHTVMPKFKPVEEYLKTQNRYAHLFEPVKQVDIINTIQKDIDNYWKR